MFTLSVDAPACGVARLRLDGHLDAEAARQVLHAAADIVRSGCTHLTLDLGGLASWDADAAFAVTGCTRLVRWLPDGVDVLADSAAGLDLADRVGVPVCAASRT